MSGHHVSTVTTTHSSRVYDRQAHSGPTHIEHMQTCTLSRTKHLATVKAPVIQVHSWTWTLFIHRQGSWSAADCGVCRALQQPAPTPCCGCITATMLHQPCTHALISVTWAPLDHGQGSEYIFYYVTLDPNPKPLIHIYIYICA